jgi:diguanylate cyclase (GGDEF)-like protein
LKSSFKEELLIKNYRRMFNVSVIVFFAVLFLYIMPERLFHYKTILLHLVIACFVFIPVSFIIKNNFGKINKTLAFIIQEVYLFIILFLCMFLVLEAQNKIDLLHIYLMAVVLIANFVYLGYFNALFLFGTIFLIFALLLPYYQMDDDVWFMQMSTTIIFNILAYVMVVLRLNSKVSSFIDKKLLEKSAQCDLMTEFYNHETSIKLLLKEIEKSVVTGSPLSLIMIDIDNFKEINDKYGHMQGDEIIKDVSDVIKKHAKQGDKIGRYGGDEFIIILPGSNLESAKEFVKNIFRMLGRRKIPVTISAGISQFMGESLNEFLKKTDTKLYKAKLSGKNRYETE